MNEEGSTRRWKCRLCKQISPITVCQCINPNCRANLLLYGDVIFGDSESYGPVPARKKKRRFLLAAGIMLLLLLLGAMALKWIPWDDFPRPWVEDTTEPAATEPPTTLPPTTVPPTTVPPTTVPPTTLPPTTVPPTTVPPTTVPPTTVPPTTVPPTTVPPTTVPPTTVPPTTVPPTTEDPPDYYQGTSNSLYESGEWDGEKCGSYRGEMTNGQPNGSGTLRFIHGGTYTGKFIGGKPYGRGTYTYANGECVSGFFTWSDGIDLDMEESLDGRGPHYEGTEMTYVGMLLDGEACGFGELDFQEGGTFYGEFRDGTVRGKGVYVYREPDPATEVTGSNWTLVNRIPSGDWGGHWYSGLKCGDTWQGYGMLCYDYSYYIGEVKDYYCNGHGTYWQWSQYGEPSGTMAQKDYGHYYHGHMAYGCTHGSK